MKPLCDSEIPAIAGQLADYAENLHLQDWEADKEFAKLPNNKMKLV